LRQWPALRLTQRSSFCRRCSAVSSVPIQQREFPLDSADEQIVVPDGDVALSVIAVNVTEGQEYELRFGRSGQWIGPFVGVGAYPMSFPLGGGLPLKDRNRGVYLRTATPTPGATAVIAYSTAGAGGS
jgi:hypothetical protein